MLDQMAREIEVAYRRERITADYAASRRYSGGHRWPWRHGARRHHAVARPAAAPRISLP
ncbi:MAG TPA: hypothetical protein VKV25_04845 [Acidimicrobiales bacterium]|nr:hypothetical protein [Acidimicrobiales bacterium]